MCKIQYFFCPCLNSNNQFVNLMPNKAKKREEQHKQSWNDDKTENCT